MILKRGERKGNKKPVCVVFAILMLSVLVLSIPSTAGWVYPDYTEDPKFETFGPRADKLLIRLYADDIAEWEALMAGEIDVTDSPLTRTVYEELTSPPYDEIIKVVNYGAEFSFFMLDMNNNGNEFLGNPPDPAYPNPVADHDPETGNPKIGGGAGPANDYNPISSLTLRRAIGHLIDRPSIILYCVGAGFAYPLCTPMPLEKYALDICGDPSVPWAWRYDPAAAATLLDAGGFPINPGTGYRFWDRNSNGNEEPDEYVELVFYIRSDHPGRNHIGTVLVAELAGINIRVNPILATSGAIFIEVTVDKDYHLAIGEYTVGCRADVDPDFLYDYFHSSQYWHPGICPNYNGIMNPSFDLWLEQLKYANTQEEAVSAAYGAQWEFAYYAFKYPILMLSGNKAHSKTYVGDTPGEQAAGYTGKNWTGVVNIMHYGTDNTWSFMNMHPEGFETGTGNMTIRWGFNIPELKQLNPVYASWCHDWKVLDRVYESLVVRNASDLNQFLPWIAEGFEVGTYEHPVYGVCSKVTFTMRNDVHWSDGTPLTTADVYFTFMELKRILEDRGLPSPFWWSDVKNILDFKVFDPYNFEVLLNVKSYWALSWVGESIILPKHVWKLIAETGDPQQDQPDPDLIGSGPWRFKEYYVNDHVLLVANRPGSTVQTNLPNSTQITSPTGYHRYHPVSAEVKVNGTSNAKIDYYSEANRLDYTLHNLHINRSITVDILLTYPDGTSHSENGVLMSASGSWVHSWTGEIKGLKTTSIEVNVTNPTEFQGCYSWIRVFYGTLITHSGSFGWVPYHVPGLDICGSTFYDDIGLPGYPYKSQLPTPDIRCDIKDLAMSAKAFGSYPGHERWGMGIADINNDYKIDIRDIAPIAKQFGWIG